MNRWKDGQMDEWQEVGKKIKREVRKGQDGGRAHGNE